MKIRIKEAVIVEGKYDKIRLVSMIDALIIPVNGFNLFKNEENQTMLRQLAERRGLLILTDSDSAGFMIRNFIRGIVPAEHLKHAYIPDVLGKEKRKSSPSKEGKLGVEGMETAALTAALRTAGVACGADGGDENRPAENKITKAMLIEDGLSGGQSSRELRRMLLSRLRLPEKMTANAMLSVLNALLTVDEYRDIVAEIVSS